MKPCVLPFPETSTFGQSADLHDVMAFVDEATDELRLNGFEPSWHHDPHEAPPIAATPILERVLYTGGWVLGGRERRNHHAREEGPALVPGL